ncbi:hypothetical protein Acr_09g0010320 [Actinidia rufa]|uniref:Uncharacterized protein n=1 Tax=Actinidia rufa TaxID=165716 RepID=A0A7J0F858_9ERIC|nr:hypothetical protein Acr_09g0010320 [Actinidia rufa]
MNAEGVRFLVESPMAKPARYDPSANIAPCPDPEPEPIVPEPVPESIDPDPDPSVGVFDDGESFIDF